VNRVQTVSEVFYGSSFLVHFMLRVLFVLACFYRYLGCYRSLYYLASNTCSKGLSIRGCCGSVHDLVEAGGSSLAVSYAISRA
jgi:hypothetical protein